MVPYTTRQNLFVQKKVRRLTAPMFAIRGARTPARLLATTVIFGGVHAYATPLRQSMVQLDACPATSRTGAVPKASNRSSHLKQDTVHQISSGSVAGESSEMFQKFSQLAYFIITNKKASWLELPQHCYLRPCAS